MSPVGGTGGSVSGAFDPKLNPSVRFEKGTVPETASLMRAVFQARRA